MAFDVDVDNPYPVPIKTPRFRYGIDIRGSRFFDSEATSQINLPARRVGTVALPVRLSYVDLFKTYQNLSGASEVDYTLNGAMLLPVLGRQMELPLSYSGKFPVLRPPSFSNIDIGFTNVSLTKTKLNVSAAMKNPNAFALGVEGLGYVLKLGNIELGGLTATTQSTLGAGQTGQLLLSGELSAANALLNILKGGKAGAAQILPQGSIETPYGLVKLR
jgi:LEA14-like dessication related protein